MLPDFRTASTRKPAIGFNPERQPTPDSNTGVNWTKANFEPVFQVGIDWISGTTKKSRFLELMQELGEFFTDEFVDQEKSMGFYQHTYKSTLGILAASDPYGIGRDDVYFSIPGSVVGAVAVERLHSLIKLLIYKYDFHFSRLDLKLDDFSKTITPELAYSAYQAGQVVGFRAHHWHSSGSEIKGIGRNLVLGRRGNKGSGKCMRIYDKAIESDGEIDATRLEGELSGDAAKSVATLLAATPSEDIATYIFDVLIGMVDFVQRNASNRLDRAVRLSWWAVIVNGRDKIKLTGIYLKSTLESAKRWIHNQVAPVLATVLNSFNGNEQDWNNWLWDILMNGEQRMQSRHHALVNVDLKHKRILAAA